MKTRKERIKELVYDLREAPTANLEMALIQYEASRNGCDNMVQAIKTVLKERN